MRARLCLASLAFPATLAVTLLAAAPPARAWTGMSGMPEARWCIVHNPGLGNIQWDCRYRTQANCAAVVGWGSDMCLENPNWNLPGYQRRR